MDSAEATSDNEDAAQTASDNDSVLGVANGFIVVDELSMSSTYDSDDQHEEASSGPAQRFDTNIPTMHKYLGGLNAISGYSIFEDGEVLQLVAIHTNTIVSPGFTLPLVLDIPDEQVIMAKCVADKCVFAVVFENERRGHIFPYGIIMEVFESFTKHDTLYLKARGRQRCKIPNQEVLYIGGRLVQITVKALAEPDIKSPICCTQLLQLKANRDYCYDSCKNDKYRRYHLAQFPYGSWVYDHNEIAYYSKLVTDSLQQYHTKEFLPTDPVSLSYWFLQNFQLLHKERLEILKKNSTLERLKLEYHYMLLGRSICCRVCRQNIAEYCDVFSMSKDGVQSNYCNPGGHVYETLTVTRITNCKLVGLPSKEFSWFPGYEWTITQCRTCKSHIGWRFSSKLLEPREFFGLAKTNLDIKILNASDSLIMEL